MRYGLAGLDDGSSLSKGARSLSGSAGFLASPPLSPQARGLSTHGLSQNGYKSLSLSLSLFFQTVEEKARTRSLPRAGAPCWSLSLCFALPRSRCFPIQHVVRWGGCTLNGGENALSLSLSRSCSRSSPSSTGAVWAPGPGPPDPKAYPSTVRNDKPERPLPGLRTSLFP